MNGNTNLQMETETAQPKTVQPEVIDTVEMNLEGMGDGAPEEPERLTSEEFRLQGDELVAKVKTLLHEGNIRRIIVKNEVGHTLIEIPLTVGVVGGVLSAAFFPILAAVGAIGALVAHLTLVIEKRA